MLSLPMLCLRLGVTLNNADNVLNHIGKLLVTLVLWYRHSNLYAKKCIWRTCPFPASLKKSLPLNAQRHSARDLAWSSTLNVMQPGAAWRQRPTGWLRMPLPSSVMGDNSLTRLTTTPKSGYSRLSHCATRCPIPGRESYLTNFCSLTF